MKVFILFILSLSSLCIGCKYNPDETTIQSISKEMERIISQKERITREMENLPLILSEESLEDFPNNRSQLEPTANKQIRLFAEMIRLDEMEIEKLRHAESLNLEKDFIEFVELMRKTQEKTVEMSKLRIQNFQLILDKTVLTRNQLEDCLSLNSQRLLSLDLEIKQLEEQREKIRINR